MNNRNIIKKSLNVVKHITGLYISYEQYMVFIHEFMGGSGFDAYTVDYSELCYFIMERTDIKLT